MSGVKTMTGVGRPSAGGRCGLYIFPQYLRFEEVDPAGGVWVGRQEDPERPADVLRMADKTIEILQVITVEERGLRRGGGSDLFGDATDRSDRWKIVAGETFEIFELFVEVCPGDGRRGGGFEIGRRTDDKAKTYTIVSLRRDQQIGENFRVAFSPDGLYSVNECGG